MDRSDHSTYLIPRRRLDHQEDSTLRHMTYLVLLFSLRTRGRVMRQRVASEALAQAAFVTHKLDVSKLHHDRCLFNPAIFMAKLDDDHTSRSNKI
jgi:hypothetical protein